MKDNQIKLEFPPEWLLQTKLVYQQYCEEWRVEEMERVLGTGDEPEPPQSWPEFLTSYHYAELENAV